jgi:hypothetical protein
MPKGWVSRPGGACWRSGGEPYEGLPYHVVLLQLVVNSCVNAIDGSGARSGFLQPLGIAISGVTSASAERSGSDGRSAGVEPRNYSVVIEPQERCHDSEDGRVLDVRRQTLRRPALTNTLPDIAPVTSVGLDPSKAPPGRHLVARLEFVTCCLAAVHPLTLARELRGIAQRLRLTGYVHKQPPVLSTPSCLQPSCRTSSPWGRATADSGELALACGGVGLGS